MKFFYKQPELSKTQNLMSGPTITMEKIRGKKLTSQKTITCPHGAAITRFEFLANARNTMQNK